MSGAPPALAIRQVTKVFAGHLGLGRHAVVSDLSLDVARGEIYGFLGANGAGKTTTIKMIVGLIFPTRGSIEILGRSIADAAARERLGYLPENPYFYDYLTAREFLRYYGQLYGIPASELSRRVDEVLERVGLSAHADVPLRKYSKGMVQRAGIAQAIVNRPDIVVLDEPMSGLDPIGRRDVRDIMLELRARGTTVFFSSHILQDAEMVCDRVAIIARGRLVTAGVLSDLLRSDAASYEVVVHVAAPPSELPPQARVLAQKDGRTLLRVEDPTALAALLERLQASGGRIEQVTPQRLTLEELFIRSSEGPGPGAPGGGR